MFWYRITTDILLSWVGSGLQILGAAGLASRCLKPRFSYALMLPGSLLWFGLAIVDHDWPLATMQGVFSVINAIGFIEWKYR